MTAMILKTNLHKAIEEINDIDILEDLSKLVDRYTKKVEVDFWNELSEEEKTEINNALNESEDEKNLISHDDVMTKMKNDLNIAH